MLLKNYSSDSNVRMYGSLETGVSTKSSDVNVDVTTKQAKEDLKTLKAVIESNHQGQLFLAC